MADRTFVHPNQYYVDGVYFRVVSNLPLDEPAARGAVRDYVGTHQFTKKHQRKVITVTVRVRDDPSTAED